MSRTKINPTVLLAIALPLFAVAASVGTAVVAVSRGDAPLPDQYHWEGVKLDHDFAQSKRAAELQFEANINLQPQKGTCYLTLSLGGAAVPAAVNVDLIHVSNPKLDRSIRFVQTATGSTSSGWMYSAPCSALPAARWHVEVSDPERSWSFRSAIAGEVSTVTLSASSPGDDPAWP